MSEKQIYENLDSSIKLLNENVELKKIIEKTIEYINKMDTFQLVHSADGFMEVLREKTKKELLEILRGDQNGKERI